MGMATVKTLALARDWFLSHSSGAVLCVRDDGKGEVCDTYGEAERFYRLPTKEDASHTREWVAETRNVRTEVRHGT